LIGKIVTTLEVTLEKVIDKVAKGLSSGTIPVHSRRVRCLDSATDNHPVFSASVRWASYTREGGDVNFISSRGTLATLMKSHGGYDDVRVFVAPRQGPIAERLIQELEKLAAA
jgi:hypothetical protein